MRPHRKSRRTHALLGALVAAGACAWFDADRARAQGAVEYVRPADPKYQPLYDKLVTERWLERMQRVLQMFRMPKPVAIKLDTCGEVDAYYSKRTVGVCYEYLQVVIRRVEAGLLPPWVSREQALAGAFVDVALHEFGHALFEQHGIPLLGREEEAADQFSAYLMLDLGDDDARGLISGTAHVYLSWIGYFQSRPGRQLGPGVSERESRAHPTPGQRLYNVVCLALGSDRQHYAALAKAVDIPTDRADDCEGEYAQLKRAFRSLIRPLVIPAKEAGARQEMRFFAQKK